VTAAFRKDSGEQAMKIMDVLNIEAINVDLKARDKKGILDELVAPVAEKTGASHEKLVKVLLERERLGSTGIGGGIGIPHGKLKHLDALILGFGLSRQGVDFESMDSRPTHIFFLLLTPESSAGVHLKLLARISRLLKNDALKKRLMQAKAPEDVIAVIQEEDEDF
jgi:PTS system nitrogen regulatory IIA component